uniref:Uncharacterized protein n=1 Tax=Romanomermis culicivorax TaxID=13658 RepID=A0A915JQA1_ROMCU
MLFGVESDPDHDKRYRRRPILNKNYELTFQFSTCQLKEEKIFQRNMEASPGLARTKNVSPQPKHLLRVEKVNVVEEMQHFY